MSTQLQEAVAAARAGQTDKAQMILAGLLYDSPDQAQAWYLLSQLVDSPARRAAYLNRTLVLDPTHERALAEMSLYPTGVRDLLSRPIAPVEEPPTPALPPATEAAVAEAPIIREATVVTTAVVAQTTPAQPADLPEWLQPLAEGAPVTVQAQTPPAQPATSVPVREQKPSPARQTTAAVEKRKREDRTLTWMLILLVLVTVVVVGFLIFLLFFS